MRVLITGGSGFLGINLVRHLLKKKIRDINVLDIEDFEYPEKHSINFTKGDIRIKNHVIKSMQGVDLVVHSAAALPLYKKKDIFSTEVDGTRILLEEAFKNKVDRFIYISTSAVYGVPKFHPVTEESPIQDVSPYCEAKILAEDACLEFRKKGMCVPVLRPKTFIGPERLGIFAIMCEWAKEGRNFPIIGNGKNSYQLLDVEDLCESIHICMIKDKKIVNDTFNIGAKNFTTMKEDFQSVLDFAGFKKKIVPFPAKPVILGLKILRLLNLSPVYRWIYDTASKDSVVSVEKAEKVLGFTPKYSNREALIRNYKWYLENYKSFSHKGGISHRVPWNQGMLKLFKVFF